MGKTIIEKILGSHASKDILPGDIVDISIDIRASRDFGGANVIKNLVDNNLEINDPKKTIFTFDCNPGGSDQKYATNQHICRKYAREHNLTVYDINAGIGTHLAIDMGLVVPGSTFVSTDSHANILGAICAFGQGMGDIDIAQAYAHGKIWFKIPETIKIVLTGIKPPDISSKDLILAVIKKIGPNGLLGYAAEFYGEVIDTLDLSGRITMASMATEMAGIIALFPTNQTIIDYCKQVSKINIDPFYADADAKYSSTITIDINGLTPQISRPGHPDDVVDISIVEGIKIDSAFIGSCTNGRFEDMKIAADILKNQKVAPGVILKIVPSTDAIWKQCLDSGLLSIFKNAGALVGNAGCAGCAAGQIGQNGPGEITISTGNRNFAGKQGKGEVYLASPAVTAASAIAGIITHPNNIPSKPQLFSAKSTTAPKHPSPNHATNKPLKISGRIWIINLDNIDTDMIYHNRYLSITDIKEMGQYTFDNLDGWKDFSTKAKKGDIVISGKNFGAGSSRQQAVDCFESLGISLIIAKSFGAIYERNAINKGFPVISANLPLEKLKSGQEISVNLETSIITIENEDEIKGLFSDVQKSIYMRGGLLA